MNYKSNKGFRLLNIYERLNKGEMIDKANLATDFGVTQKTIPLKPPNPIGHSKLPQIH